MAEVELTIESGIARVTLNRPGMRNSLTFAMWKDIARIFTELGKNRDVRTIILAGAGGNFSVGADIAEFAAVRSDAADSAAYERAVDAASDAIAVVPHPVIAVLRGYCLGGGCHLSMACDFRIAHTAASIGIPAANLSIVYGVRSTQRLLSLVGLSHAKRLLFAADRLDAARALEIGLVDQVSDDPEGAALAEAQAFSSKAPLSIAGAKYILNATAMNEEPRLAQALIDAASDSEDYKEAREAFAAKRQPNFRGC